MTRLVIYQKLYYKCHDYLIMLISIIFCFNNYLMNFKSSLFDGYFNFL